ncbi:MAG: hypothetical protein P1U85_19840 [Verrucomicrobiales bacterium]|nr:hypothetical protein [Verrucomicrobiales bacterium]
MAKRYDQKTKDEVVAFIQKYNEDNGRGGQSAAVKKWKLNPITVKAWLEKAGVATPGKTAKKKKSAGAKTRSKKSVAVSSNGSVSSTLKRMVAIREQIESLQSEYDALKSNL